LDLPLKSFFQEFKHREKSQTLPEINEFKGPDAFIPPKHFYIGEKLNALNSANSMRIVVATKSFQVALIEGFAIANCDVEMKYRPEKKFPGTGIAGVLICDGSVNCPDANVGEAVNVIQHALIVTRGNCHLPSSVINAHIYASGDIVIPDGANLLYCTLRAGGRIIVAKSAKIAESKLEDFKPNAIKPFRFFELAQDGVGLEAEEVKGRVLVKKLHPGSPFQDQFQVGDAIRSVDGKPVRTVDEIRKFTRTAYVKTWGDFLRERAGKTETVRVRFEAK
jgi:hypothetical protein